FGILGLIVGIAGYWPASQTPVSPVAKRALAAEMNAIPSQASPNFKTTDSGNLQSQPSSKVENSNVAPSAATRNIPKTEAAEKPEADYYCGAETKKGTPCTRKVKGNVRCWQHQGMPAMLPPSKLVVSN